MVESPLVEDSAFTRRGPAWSEVTRLGAGEFRVRLGGPFRGAWLTTLSNRLAARQISIDHSHARATTDQVWIAEFHLLSSEPADLLSLDYVALVEGANPAPRGPFALDSYRLIESRDYGGTLMLTLEAADSLGLLGGLLSAFDELGLHPLELHAETRGGRAYDSVWFSFSGGARPSVEVRAAAERLLQCSLTASQ